ncbi:hypothetical protein [Aerosakkonema funiforme]|uniref:Uncharacterized protein n=1 Tax=Aerosakkonema funiforme FACHB-1375 TaxID=2949571 RepID=A0A926VCY0_9CYAN|nr:hypothetical protein [Aerosakkonema funiforme]MBD2181517.1 hypothetical protein [Aerosakkonema funiforme FACHB-1375]
MNEVLGENSDRTTKKKCDRSPANHRILILEIDKIVRGKRGWVYLR